MRRRHVLRHGAALVSHLADEESRQGEPAIAVPGHEVLHFTGLLHWSSRNMARCHKTRRGSRRCPDGLPHNVQRSSDERGSAHALRGLKRRPGGARPLDAGRHSCWPRLSSLQHQARPCEPHPQHPVPALTQVVGRPGVHRKLRSNRENTTAPMRPGRERVFGVSATNSPGGRYARLLSADRQHPMRDTFLPCLQQAPDGRRVIDRRIESKATGQQRPDRSAAQQRPSHLRLD
jgi:hypothetical protein